MRAIQIKSPGAEYRLVVADIPRPPPRAGEVLIKVAAAGVNHADLVQAQGRYPPPAGASDILGLEVSGAIAALGSGVSGVYVGDAVCALLSGGGYAEFATAPIECVLPIPEGVPPADAAALPEAFFTVWTNLFDTARLRVGETALVHGGSSGIGTAAIQLCVARGHTVFTTAGSAEKCAACQTGCRARHQLPERGFRSGGEAAHKSPRCRRDPRHGGRRLYPAQYRCSGSLRPHRQHCLSEWDHRDGELRTGADEAVIVAGNDLALPHERGERRDPQCRPT
jgi:NADPH:quinone reductase-like Zn-dependent oxidoreductase